MISYSRVQNESPTLDTFQDLLERNALVFYSARTAKSLHTHWQLMKQYALLPDQQSQLVAAASAFSASFGAISGISGRHNEPSTGNVPAKLQTFDEAEAELNDAELLAEQRDDTIELELTLADRCNKKEIRMLENELTRWTVLVDSLTGVGFIPEFDNQTLAVLRGRLVRYLMRSREISFGRTTKDQAVDVDLSLEGPAHKASRRQGTIKLRSNGDFFIVNEGKRPLYIDGAPLLQGTKGRLGNNAVIEVSSSGEGDRLIAGVIRMVLCTDGRAAFHISHQQRSDQRHQTGERQDERSAQLKCYAQWVK